MNLHRFKTFENAWMINPDGSLKKISKEEFDEMQKSGKAQKISLKDVFKGPIKSPYVGLVIKTNAGRVGVIIDVFQRNDDYLMDLYMANGEIEKNLSWNRDYKTAFGDKVHGWSAFGDYEPNKRHAEEILPIIQKAEDRLGITLNVAKDENLN